MKEATGELNMSVVVVLAVSLLAVFFFSYLWPMIKANYERNAKCSAAICEKCPAGSTCKEVKCHLKDNDSVEFTCVYKG